MMVYVGTYAEANDPGIYVYDLDYESGEMSLVTHVSGILNPSFLEPDWKHGRLFAVSEATTEHGHLAVYTIAKDQTLTQVSLETTCGVAPCYVQVDKRGQFAVVSNYSGGNIVLFSVHEDGRLALEHSVSHQGKSVNAQRQEGPHPHSTVIGPTGHIVYVQDLGTDEIVIYRLDTEAGKLVKQGTVSTHPGSGPRHLVFHPILRAAYLVGELDSTVTVFAVGGEDGQLTEVETVSMLPSGYDGTSLGADIHVSPDGRFVYASNRGHDSIVVFAVKPDSGRLTRQGFVSTQGQFPRNFALTPDGNMMLIANQHSNSIVTYLMDKETGMPTDTLSVTNVNRPVCIRF